MGCPTGWTMTMMGWMDHCYELHGVFFSGWNDAGGITFKNHIFIASSLSLLLRFFFFVLFFCFFFSVKVVLLFIQLSCAIRVWIGLCSFSAKVYLHLYNSISPTHYMAIDKTIYAYELCDLFKQCVWKV